MECSIEDIAPTQTALTDTFVLPVKEITLGSPAQQGKDPPFISNNVQASLRPLTLECETSLSQLPFSMLSTPTPLCSELTLSLCPLIHNLVILLITHLTTYQPSSLKDSPQNITHYHDHSSMSVSTAHYYTYLVNIMITMHPLFQHHSCNLLLSNT